MPGSFGDFVELNIGGKQIKIPRGDMTDEQWEKVKSDVAARGAGLAEDAYMGFGAQMPAPEVPIGTDVGKSVQKSRSMEVARHADGRAPEKPGGDYMWVTWGEGDRTVVPRAGLSSEEWQSAKQRAQDAGVFIAAIEGEQEKPAESEKRGRAPGPMGAAAEMISQASMAAAPGVIDPDRPVRLGGPHQPSLAEMRAGATAAPQVTPGLAAMAPTPSLAAQAPFAPKAPAPTGAAPAPQTTDASVKVTGGVVPSVNATAGLKEQLEAATKARGDAELSVADTQAKYASQVAERQASAIDQLASSQRMQHDMQQRRQAAQQAAQQAYEKTITQMNDPSMTVDKNRFWNSRSTGQKVLAGVSILLGGVGQGTFAALGINKDNDALKIIRDAIRQDVEVQQTNIENRRVGMRDQAAGQRVLYDMLRQSGLDELEAFRAEEAAKIDMVQREIERLGTLMQGDEAKAKAQAGVAALQQEKVKLFFEIGQHVDKMAIERAQLANQSIALRIKQEAAKAQQGEQLRGPQAEKLGQFEGAHQIASRLKSSFGALGTGVVDQLMSKVAAHVPRSAESSYNTQVQFAISQIGTMVDGSVLQKHDLERWNEMMPRAGDLNGAQKLDLLLKDIEDTHNARLGAFRKAGFGVQNFSPLSSGGGAADLSPDDMRELGLE